MSTNDPVVSAQRRSTRARDELSDTLAALKQRLGPKTIARNVAQGVSEKSTDAVHVVKAYPGVAAGLAGLAALFFARKPIVRAISRRDKATAPEAARSPD